jgi:hypothetical protein
VRDEVARSVLSPKECKTAEVRQLTPDEQNGFKAHLTFLFIFVESHTMLILKEQRRICKILAS